ncbi:group III truncated hemoglobin [Amylibacter marinus]|uniref:group III truncated hemoglobin n=1 Tax=Amylibacter marinus TaxID=1475483 RepID=UPI0024E0C5BE|nr:group III truncated hemoglobin [Amylibacter marinus]
MSSALTPPNPITRSDISRVVKSFYSKVRTDPQLSAVFAQSIPADHWPAHEDKITDFWANAILQERRYSGNPLQVHRAQGHIQPEHFAIWLDLFDQTLAEILPSQHAAAFSKLAHRIGASLRMGMEPPKAQGIPSLG